MISSRNEEAIVRGHSFLQDLLKNETEEYRNLFLRLWETAAGDELCASDNDSNAVNALGWKIKERWESYGLSSDNERELDRLLVTRTAYKSFEDSLLGFRTEMLEKYGNTDTFRALENNIHAWRQWWLEHTAVRNMTDFEFGVSVLKCVAWTSENR